ncbi:flagellar hook assembly protein FlgD [Caulobacter sp.]|uniref:flagellar hook assembly protein FlgD n=1 Tax=Caulobacter sp. TaxID=78 RepID=UPI003BAAEC2B
MTSTSSTYAQINAANVSTATTSTSAVDKIKNSRTSLATNEQTFLKLLTTQLKNQDPLSPTDTTQMTSQITQMTGVEQQLVTNDLLTALIGMNTGSGLSEAVGMMDKLVTAETATSTLKDKEATFVYSQAGGATQVKVEITNAAGKVVRTISPDDLKSGSHTLKWDGKDQDGKQLDDGDAYSIKVTASGADGKAITTKVAGRIQGVVTAVDNSTGQTMLTINGKQVALDAVIGVTNPPATAATTTDTDTKAAA